MDRVMKNFVIALPGMTRNLSAQISRIIDVGVISYHGDAQKPKNIYTP